MGEVYLKNRHGSWLSAAFLAVACFLFLCTPCSATDYKMEKQVEMNGQDEASVSGSSYTEITYPIWFNYTSSQYSNATIYFEAVIKAGSGTAYAALYTQGFGGSVVSGSEVSTASTTYTRVRSSAITLSTGSTYVVRLKNSGAGATSVKNCRLIIVQSSTSPITATETHVHMSGYNYYSGTSYTEDTGNGLPVRFYYDGNRFSKNVGVYLEAVVKEDDYSCGEYDGDSNCISWKTGYVELYDVTYGQQACEISTTSTTSWERQRSSSGCTMVSGNEYTIRMKNSYYGNTTYMAGAKLVIQQWNTSGIVRTESYYQLATNYKTYTDGSYTQTEQYNQFDPTNWGPTTPTYFHETTYKMSSGSYTGYIELYNYTDASSINALSGSATSLTRSRSGSAITMPSSAQTLETREYRSNGTLTITGNRVVVQSTNYLTSYVDTIFSDDSYVFDSTNQRKIVRDASGIWYVVYVKWEGSRYTVRLARSTDCGGSGGTCTWSSVPLFGYNGILDSTANSWISPSIDVNASRTQLHLVVARIGGPSNRLYYAMCPDTANWDQASGWFHADGTTQGGEEVTSAIVGDPNPVPVVAVDSNGYSHIVYERHDYSYPDYYNEISYIKYTGSAWSSMTQVTNGSFNGYEYVKPTIDIGYNDVVHILYLAYENSALSGYHPSYFLYCNSTDNFFTKTTVISEDTAYTGFGPSIAALTNENKVWVTGFVAFINEYLRFNYSSDGGTTWSGGSGGTTVSTSGDFRYPVVGLDLGGDLNEPQAARGKQFELLRAPQFHLGRHCLPRNILHLRP